MKQISLTNSLNKRKENLSFSPSQKVVLYACGITPYSFSHIGHARSAITFDILVRILRFEGAKPFYVRNITDIDDKILKIIDDHSGNITEKINSAVSPYVKDYAAQLSALNCSSPDAQPRVTEYIPQIIDLIERLISRGHAYQIDSDVYFDVTSYQSYGALSGRTLEQMLAGTRIELNDNKRHPADFALWKGNHEELYWKSPWGHGRPGWHIECSAMSYSFAPTLDIHGGGADLLFPHHENERAQSEAGYEKPIAKIWLHNGLVTIDQEKMSKSLGNMILLKDAINQYRAEPLRYYFLQHSYRHPLNFSSATIESSTKAYQRLQTLLSNTQTQLDLQEAITQSEKTTYKPYRELIKALADDLNTPRALAVFFEQSQEIRSSQELIDLGSALAQHLLGLYFTSEQREVPEKIKELLLARETARSKKDWHTADRIRDEILAAGYEVQDKKPS